jgi:uncharacterized protein YcbK (DUF882 family)
MKYTEIKPEDWKWRHFTPRELACRGDGEILVVPDAIDKLETMRVLMQAPLNINSAYRSPSYNESIGGSKNSMHMKGIAFDIAIGDHHVGDLIKNAMLAGFTGIGIYKTFVHVDTGRKRHWFG